MCSLGGTLILFKFEDVSEAKKVLLLGFGLRVRGCSWTGRGQMLVASEKMFMTVKGEGARFTSLSVGKITF